MWILCHAHGLSLQQILKITPNFQAAALPREPFLSLSPALVLIPFPPFLQFGSLPHELLWVTKGQTQAWTWDIFPCLGVLDSDLHRPCSWWKRKTTKYSRAGDLW